MTIDDQGIMFDLNTYLAERIERINAALGSILKTSEPPDRLLEAMTYSLMAGGKRFRSVLCVAAAEAFGGKLADVLPAASFWGGCTGTNCSKSGRTISVPS